VTKALDYAHYAAKAWIEGLDERPVAARATLRQLRKTFQRALPETGMKAEEVIRWIAENANDGMLGSAGGRFFGWVIGGGLESALAADWLVATWDQNAALYACGPAAAVIEEAAGEWIKSLLDLPREASFAFTTGCQLAHVTSLAAARYAVPKRANWDVENDGMFGAPRVTIMTNHQKHGSIERAARYLGFGRASLMSLQTDAAGRVMPQALERALVNATGHVIVILNAADLNVGACDPFAKLIPVAKLAGAWVHIDGASTDQCDRRGILLGYDLAWATSHAGKRCQLADVRKRRRARDRRSALGPRCRPHVYGLHNLKVYTPVARWIDSASQKAVVPATVHGSSRVISELRGGLIYRGARATSPPLLSI